ncbi:MAG TPA: DUF2946 family protein [Rhodoblastus sp.]|nr:DUF2946 family protein [Rhodoblastus sp.]
MAEWRIRAALPVFLIALLLQIFAPAGASLAMARAMQAAPLGFAPICGEINPAGGKNGAPVTPDECCQLCHFVHSGAAPLAPQAILMVRPAPEMRRSAWSARADHLADNVRYYHAAARAPPVGI